MIYHIEVWNKVLIRYPESLSSRRANRKKEIHEPKIAIKYKVEE